MRTALRLALQAGAAFALLVGGIALFQDRLIYLPQRASVDEMQRASGLRAWPDAGDLRGLIGEPAETDPPPRATAIVFHGNAGHAGHRRFYVDALRPLGVRVILAEYPGYGARGGAVGEASLVADAEQAIVRAHRAFGAPLVVVGESLGAGVAAAAAARRPGLVAGLLLITPWDRLEHVAAHHYPWLPVRWLLRDRYDSAANLAAFAAPVLVVVAERDEIVPARLGRALHAALGGPGRLVTIAAAGHNDWPGGVDAAWWRDVLAYLLGPRPA